MTQAIGAAEQEPFDLDEATRAALEDLLRAPAPYDLADLWRLMGNPALLPAGAAAKIVSLKEAFWDGPAADATVRVTTDPDYYEQHSDSVELWSPGSPAFGARVTESSQTGFENAATLSELLDAYRTE